MPNKLEQLKKYTVVVADTGDIEAIRQHLPQDATTNPSLLLKAANMPQYQSLVDDAINWAKQQSKNAEQQQHDASRKLTINFGSEILKIIPGRVSTEVDAKLSFDVEGTIDQAKQIIDLYEQHNVSKDRVLIKIAATWEGIQAATQLEKIGIHCNMTLIFSFVQAVKCADAGVTLISPFVGRIYDWYKQKEQRDFSPAEDPGVLSVKRIFNYYKHFNFKTIIMGASFRNIGQIEELAGCDYLTISPTLLSELQSSQGELKPKLKAEKSSSSIQKLILDENQFRWLLNEDAMATEKLAEGVRLFSRDMRGLEEKLSRCLMNATTTS